MPWTLCLNFFSVFCYPSLAENPIQYKTGDMVAFPQNTSPIQVHLIYSTTDNFLHEDVYGELETCFLRREVADKLIKAQSLLEGKRKGYRLVVYDCLRPRTVQYKMWKLVKGTEQERYVADPEKGSIHNFGAAVDVSIVDDHGNSLDMGTPFDFFGRLSQPRYEEELLREGLLTEEQVNNRKLLRGIMCEAGFETIPEEWWHFNGFSPEEVRRRYAITEFILPRAVERKVLLSVKDLSRDDNGRCILIKGSEKKLYLIEGDTIRLVFDAALGKGGLGKVREGDHKTPLGDYRIKWMVSRMGPPKQNPGGKDSFIVPGKTYAVLDTELFFGSLETIRVKVLPDGTRVVSDAERDRPISSREIEIAQGEKLWTDAYGGERAYVMALDYPNREDREKGRTGSCIEIHASVNLEKAGYERYEGTLGCISLYPAYAKRIYELVNPGTPVRIIK